MEEENAACVSLIRKNLWNVRIDDRYRPGCRYRYRCAAFQKIQPKAPGCPFCFPFWLCRAADRSKAFIYYHPDPPVSHPLAAGKPKPCPIGPAAGRRFCVLRRIARSCRRNIYLLQKIQACFSFNDGYHYALDTYNSWVRTSWLLFRGLLLWDSLQRARPYHLSPFRYCPGRYSPVSDPTAGKRHELPGGSITASVCKAGKKAGQGVRHLYCLLCRDAFPYRISQRRRRTGLPIRDIYLPVDQHCAAALRYPASAQKKDRSKIVLPQWVTYFTPAISFN